jgi:ribosomal protein S18 acetylase RimI-like enzyme
MRQSSTAAAETRPDGAVSVRPVTENDRQFLLDVYASTRAAELEALPWAPTEKDAFVRMQFDAQDAHYRREFPDADYSVVVVDGKAAGRISVDRSARVVTFLDIALLPAYRGRGIGTALTAELLAEARESGRPVRLHVDPTSEARRLYERLGFVLVEDLGMHLLMEWRPQ